MDVRWYQRGVKAKKMAVDFGWNLLRVILFPIVLYYEPQRAAARHEKQVQTLTRENAIRIVAKEIAKNVARSNYPLFLLVCEWMDNDLESNVTALWSFNFYLNFLKSNKSKISYSKYFSNLPRLDLGWQEEIFADLKTIKGIKVEEMVETHYKRYEVKGYQKTIVVSLD
jgi:hypothetical protein